MWKSTLDSMAADLVSVCDPNKGFCLPNFVNSVPVSQEFLSKDPERIISQKGNHHSAGLEISVDGPSSFM